MNVKTVKFHNYRTQETKEVIVKYFIILLLQIVINFKYRVLKFRSETPEICF